MNQTVIDPPTPSTAIAETPRFLRPQRIAFIQACWHRDVVDQARISFVKALEAYGIQPSQVDLFEVPGSLEIPLHAQLLAKTRRYTAIVCAGLIVDGGIYRHEFVSDAVIKGLMDVQLRMEVPVFSVVLTPKNFQETDAHIDFFRNHFVGKGVEAAHACATTLLSIERLGSQVAAGMP